MAEKTRQGNNATKADTNQNDTSAAPSCHHGSSEQEFNNGGGEYLKAVEEYIHRAQILARKQQRPEDAANLSKKFADDYSTLMKDIEFGKFLFAYCTREYFNSNTLKKPVQRTNIRILLALGFLIRYHYIPLNEGKNVGCGSEYMEDLSKYNRDIYTDRGIINCLARETPCKCMKDGKKEAKTMDKIGYCFGCKQEFPKDNLLVCSGCNDVKYHSRDCQLKYWSDHKIQCRLKQQITKRNDEIEALVDGLKRVPE